MNQKEIRGLFYGFFQERNHRKVLSSPLVPAKDPTLLFTNAGMNQFKGVFLQSEQREYKRAVSIQKCMRVSGKHNDFDEVGKTDFHHTFFEMLGNFSFGDYFKEEAITYAWELLTLQYHLPPERLSITVFRDDDEAHRIWEKQIGIPADRIHRLGEKDNFWQMGDTGPCGPCSEIHFDRGEPFGPPDFVDGNRRFVEIWNLVFMQFVRETDGKLTPLPAPSIDTGMGMERLAAVLQGVSSNYDTDLFRPLIEFTAELARLTPDDSGHRVDFNVIADHARALTFLIADGVVPANEGRGYVLRRLLRRAVKHGRSLGFTGHFLGDVCCRVIELMAPHYPELVRQGEFINRMVTAEEERFNRTLLNGLRLFEELLTKTQAAKNAEISGRELFKLADTYGFPIDFARDLAMENGIGIDLDEYRRELEQQKERSRSNLKEKRKEQKGLAGIDSYQSEFTGYEELTEEARILAIYYQGQPVEQMTAGQTGLIVTDRTPFYPEGGGQTGDRGSGKHDHCDFSVTDTRRAGQTAIIQHIEIHSGILSRGDDVRLEVDEEHRRDTAVHHSSTHLLHAALREVIGGHVKQSGSFVSPDKLRFDFTHFQPLTSAEIEAVEEMVNRKIRANLPVRISHMAYDEAIRLGVIAIFEEKYGDRVRVIEMEGFSRELCGGTHLHASGEIGFFKIISESSISSGIRRIDAIAGRPAWEWTHRQLATLQKIIAHFGHRKTDLLSYLLQLEEKTKQQEKGAKKTPVSGSTFDIDKALTENRIEAPVPALFADAGEIDPKAMTAAADALKMRLHGIAILFSRRESRTHLVVSVHPDLTKEFPAHIIMGKMTAMINGKGGGRADFAQGGGESFESPEEFIGKITALLNGGV